MPSLGNLFVTIGAKTDALEKGLNKVEKSLLQTDISMRKLIKSSALLAAGAAVAGAGLVAALVQKGRLAIDSQAKLAQALDGTIGGLRALEMAAGDAGVAESELSGEMIRFNSRIGQAATGTGAAADALKRLNIDARELSGLDLDERMALVADRMHELGLNSSTAQAELRDLGIRNENLANMMRQGGDAIRAQAQEVRDLGLNLSMVDAAQVEIANDALGVFGDVLTGIQDRLTVAAAPYITEISERFREAAIESGGFKDEIEASINTGIKGFGKFADVLHALRVVFKGIEVAAVAFGAVVISSVQLSMEAFSKLDEGVSWVANNVISAANAMGANIAPIDPFTNSPFMAGLREIADEARNKVGEVRGEFHDMAMQEVPSSKVDKFLADVAKNSKETAEQVVSDRAKILGTGTIEGDGEDEAAAQQKLDAELEAIKNRYLTEEELLRQHREMMLVIGEEFDAAKFETEEQWRSVREQAEAEHLDRMTELNRNAYDGIQNLISSRWGNAAASTAGALKSILGTMAVGSRKAFEVSKAWAIGDALVSTYQGIAKGVAKGFAGIPEVAWAAATGFAQVSAIRSQSFGGAGGAAASGQGTPATAPNPVGVGGSGGGGGSNQTLTVAPIDPNAIFSGAAMQQFGQKIYDYSKDGAKVIFSA
jgi:hypothetical protein